MPVFEVYETMKEFNEMRRMEDEALKEWEKKVKIKICSCGNSYSYGYEPVMEDPGGCQNCLGTGGELIY